MKKLVADMASWGDDLFDRLLAEVLRGLSETAARVLLLAAAYRLPMPEAAFEFHAEPTPTPSQEGNWSPSAT